MAGARRTVRSRLLAPIGLVAAAALMFGAETSTPMSTAAARAEATEAFDLFVADVEGHDWLNAYLLAHLSHYVYLEAHDAHDVEDPARTTEAEFLQTFRDHVEPLGIDPATVQYVVDQGSDTNPFHTDTEAVVLETDDAIVVVFRGTEGLSLEGLVDWGNNGQYVPQDGAGAVPGVHTGFANAAMSVYDDVRPRVDTAVGQGKQVWLTGHSLGGALAATTAWFLDQGVDVPGGPDLEPVDVQGMTSFGAPRVFSETVAAAFDTAFGDRAQRWVDDEDLVPHVPPPSLPDPFEPNGPLFRFEHVGTVHNIVPDGAGGCAVALDDDELGLGLSIADHNMARYTGRIHSHIPADLLGTDQAALVPAPPDPHPDDGPATTCSTDPRLRDTLDLVLNPGSGAPDLDLDLPDLGFLRALETLATGLTHPLTIDVDAVEGLGPVTLDASQLNVDLGARTVTVTGGANLSVGAGPKSVELTLVAEWPSLAVDAVPTIRLELDGTAASWTVADLLALDLLDLPDVGGFAPDTGLSGFLLAFQWDPTGAHSWLDVTADVTLGVDLHALMSVDAREGHDPVAVYALCSENTTLGALLGDPAGLDDVAADLSLPGATLATVQGADTPLTVADLRAGTPSDFFAGCAPPSGVDPDVGDFPDDLAFSETLSVAATLPTAPLPEQVRLPLGLDGTEVVTLAGELGLALAELGEPVELTSASLRAILPGVQTDPGVLPFWLETGDWELGLAHAADTDGVELFASTPGSVAFHDGVRQHTVGFDDLRMRFRSTADGVRASMAAVSTDDLTSPLGLDWLQMTAVRLQGAVGTEGGVTFDLSLASDFLLCTVARQPGLPCPTETAATAELLLEGSEDAVAGSARVLFGDGASTIPVGEIAHLVAAQFPVEADAFGDLRTVDLEELSLAARVSTDGSVRFEGRVVGPEFLDLGRFTAYVAASYDGELALVFGARPAGELTLGALVPGVDFGTSGLDTMALPTVGMVVSTTTMSQQAHELTPDAFEFMKMLHGCPAGAIQPVATGPQPDGSCAFRADLDGGVNLLSNIAFPEQFDDLQTALYFDDTGGVQVRGTLNVDLGVGGDDVSVGLGLRLAMPRIMPPDEMEWLEGGEFTLVLEATAGTTPSLELALDGEIDTRWRRSDTPLGAAEECAAGTRMYSYPDDHQYYCYDQLTFGGRNGLTVSADGLIADMLLALRAGTSCGWVGPFGVEFMAFHDLRLRLELGVTSAGALTVGMGFLGDAAVGPPEALSCDAADPDEAIRFSMSASMGVDISVPPPPPIRILPNFHGVRGFVSRIGMSDLARLQAAFAGSDTLLDVSTLPDVELRNAEFMFGLRDVPELCIQQGLGLAGELWVNPTSTSAGGDADPGGATSTGDCREFGADVGPENCTPTREQGCFASAIVDVGLGGIRAAGAIGEFEVGGVTFQDALVDLTVRPDQQTFVMHGGVGFGDLGSSSMAMSLQALPPTASLYGHLDILEGTFSAVVDGLAGVDLGVVPFGLDSDLSFRAALNADFDAEIDQQVGQRLRALSQDVKHVEQQWNSFASDPVGTIENLVADLREQGIPVPAWVDELIDHIQIVNDAIAEVESLVGSLPSPSLGALLGGEPYVVTYDAIRTCPWGQDYQPRTDTCSGGSTPTYWCVGGLLGFETSEEGTCTFTFVLPELPSAIPSTVSAIEEAMGDLLAQSVAALDHVPDLIPPGFSLSDYLDALAGRFTGTSFFRTECAEFSFASGTTGTEVDLRIHVELLETTYRFGAALDLNDPVDGVVRLVDDLVAAHLGIGSTTDQVACSGPADPPPGVSEATALTLDLAAAPAVVDEGEDGVVTVQGEFSALPAEPLTVRLDWGDGTVDEFTAATSTFTRTHWYADDRPTGVADEVVPISATVAGSTIPKASTLVSVRNVAPAVELIELPDADEGAEATLRFRVTDPGSDTHEAVVDWGDGTVSVPFAVTAGDVVEATHVYLDDDPSGTTSDDVAVQVTVTDDDTSEGSATGVGTVHDVAPDLPSTSIQAITDTSIDEGDAAAFTIAFDDPGVLDSHVLQVDWGDGSDQDLVVVPPVANRAPDDSVEVVLSHTWADDDPTGTPSDPYDVTIRIADDDGLSTSQVVGVTVHNVVPSNLHLDIDTDPIDELGTVTVSGSFKDPGLPDSFTVHVDWGHDALTDSTVSLAAGTTTFETSRQYGDRGDYTITVTVWDDDRDVTRDVEGDHTVAGTIAVAVDNVDPSLAIDEADAVDPPSDIPTLLATAGESLTMAATASDPGSDDLTLTWDWDDGTPNTAQTSWRAADGSADPYPSPHVAPRQGADAAILSADHVWSQPCLYDVSVTVDDDDGGSTSDAVPVAVLGTDDRMRTAGWWYTQMNRPGHNAQSLTTDELTCRLAVVNHLSAVFVELRDADDTGSAAQVLTTKKTSAAAEILDRQLLALWLNLANGAVGWDEPVDTTDDGVSDTTLAELLADAEALRVDPAATSEALLAQADRLEAVNAR